jgi:hypothetical protein
MERITKVKVSESGSLRRNQSDIGIQVNSRQRFALLGFIVLNCWVLLSLRHNGFLLAQILPACCIISLVLLLKFFQR